MPSVVHLDTSRTWRGGQLQVFLLHREFMRKGVPSQLMVRAGGALHHRCEEAGLPVEPVPLLRPWFPPAVVAVVRNASRAAILHAHDSHAMTLSAMAHAANPQLSVVCHRRIALPLRGSANARWKYGHVDRWIAVSEEIAESLRRFGATDPRVVHSAVDVEGLTMEGSNGYLNEVRRELCIPPESQVVGLFGSLVPQKGHEVLVAAATAILAEAPGTVFLITGEGPLDRQLRRAINRAGLGGAFRLPGFRRDVAPLIGLSTVVVVPSVRGEGSSAVIKEAMVLGRPVVASDLPGNREVLDEAGMTCPVGDPGELAMAVASLLGDERRRNRLGALGNSRCERWLPERMASEVLAAYGGLGPSTELIAEAV